MCDDAREAFRLAGVDERHIDLLDERYHESQMSAPMLTHLYQQASIYSAAYGTRLMTALDYFIAWDKGPSTVRIRA